MDSTPVARWEFWSVAIMLIATHGDLAEETAQQRLSEALTHDDSGAAVTWREVAKYLPRIRLEQSGAMRD